MHYAIAVITHGKPTPSDIKKALAPFQENNLGDVSPEYLQFNLIDDDEVKDYRNEYKVGTVKRDGKELQIKKIMSFREYMTEENGFDYNKSTKEYGYYDNPNARWDRYKIGGRWCAELVVPTDCECVIGEKDFGYKDEDLYKSNDPRYKKCDGARIKSIVYPDIEKRKTEASRFWEMFIEGDSPRDDEEKMLLKEIPHTKEFYLTRYQTKENYIRCESLLLPDGYLKDGIWTEPSHRSEAINWFKNYTKAVFEEAGNDDWITVVDCHRWL